MTVSKSLIPFHRLAGRIPPSWLPGAVRDRLETFTGDPDSRLPKPLDSSIRWVPEGYVDHAPTAEQPFDLFVDHLVLRDVTAHLLGARTNGSFGLLTGKLLTCTSSDMPYVRIRDAHPAEQPLPETEDVGVFRQHLKEVAEQAELDDEEVLGWYHAHTLLGVTLTKRDSWLHIEHFHQPWQCALVIVPAQARPKGGFFTRLRGDGSFRRATVPFFEVVPMSELGDQPAPTYSGWQNCEADRPYIRLLPDQLSAAQPGGIRGAAGAGPPGDQPEADQPGAFEILSPGAAAPEPQLTSQAVGADALASGPGEADAALNSADVVDEPMAKAAETREVGADIEATEEPASASETEAPTESADSSTGEPAVVQSDVDGADESADVGADESVIAEREDAVEARTHGPLPAQAQPEPDDEPLASVGEAEDPDAEPAPEDEPAASVDEAQETEPEPEPDRELPEPDRELPEPDRELPEPVGAVDMEVQTLEKMVSEKIGTEPASKPETQESEPGVVNELETGSAEKTEVVTTGEAPSLGSVYSAKLPEADYAALSEPELEEADEVEAAGAAVAAEVTAEPDAEAAIEPIVGEDEAGDAAEATEAKPDKDTAIEPAVEEGRVGPLLDPLLKTRLEALRSTTPPVRTFRQPRDHTSADAVTPEVTEPETEADEAAASELRWQRWSRRSARSDSAE